MKVTCLHCKVDIYPEKGELGKDVKCMCGKMVSIPAPEAVAKRTNPVKNVWQKCTGVTSALWKGKGDKPADSNVGKEVVAIKVDSIKGDKPDSGKIDLAILDNKKETVRSKWWSAKTYSPIPWIVKKALKVAIVLAIIGVAVYLIFSSERVQKVINDISTNGIMSSVFGNKGKGGETSTKAQNYSDMGWQKYKYADYKGALDDFNKAVSLNPKDIEVLKRRGYAKLALDDAQGALEDWAKVTEADPDPDPDEKVTLANAINQAHQKLPNSRKVEGKNISEAESKNKEIVELKAKLDEANAKIAELDKKIDAAAAQAQNSGGGPKEPAKIVCPKCGGRGAVKCQMCNEAGKIVCPTCKGDKTVKCTSCVDGKQDCGQCNGKGQILYTSMVDGSSYYATCTNCKGSGKVKCQRCGGTQKIRCSTCQRTGIKGTCPTCKGKGFLECKECDGSGYILKQ